MIRDSLSDVLCFHDLYTFERYWLGISQNVVQFGFDTCLFSWLDWCCGLWWWRPQGYRATLILAFLPEGICYHQDILITSYQRVHASNKIYEDVNFDLRFCSSVSLLKSYPFFPPHPLSLFHTLFFTNELLSTVCTQMVGVSRALSTILWRGAVSIYIIWIFLL